MAIIIKKVDAQNFLYDGDPKAKIYRVNAIGDFFSIVSDTPQTPNLANSVIYSEFVTKDENDDVLVDGSVSSLLSIFISINAIVSAAGAAGSGDMLRSVYDTDANGVVDNSEKVNNLTVETPVPALAIFPEEDFTTILKNKLDGVDAGAEVNETGADITAHGHSSEVAAAIVAHLVSHAPDNAQKNSDILIAEIEAVLIGADITSHGHSAEIAAAIVAHLVSHAPDDAQKNSDILKAEIEAVLTGVLSSHSHAGGGGSDPNIFVPTVTTDFTSPNPVNANKIWDIQDDFDLTAGDCDLSAVANVIFSFSSGSLTTTGTIIGNNTSIMGMSRTASYMNAEIDFEGTWFVNNISMHWFGIKTHAESALYDNKPAMKNAVDMACNSGHCEVHLYNIGSEYYVSAIAILGVEDQNVNIGIYNTTHVDLIGNNFPIIHALDLNTGTSVKSMIFQFFKSPECTIRGFEIVGDSETTTYTPEHKMGIMFSNGADNCKAIGNNIHHFTGDGAYFQLKGYVGYTPNQGDADFDTGSLDVDTGALVPADTHLMSSNSFLDITSSLFQDKGYLYVIGKVDIDDYKIAYYSAASTASFIGKTDFNSFYDRIYFPEGAMYAKLEIGYEAVLDTTRPISIQGLEMPTGIEISGNEIHHCWRQGISNATHHTTIKDNVIHDIYGQAAGPCAAIDLEDGGYYTAHCVIDNNTMYNNSGGSILLLYNRSISVTRNKCFNKGFLEADKALYYGSFSTGLLASFSEGTIVTGNRFIGQSVLIGRGVDFHDNFMKNSSFKMEKTYCLIHDNQFVNCLIGGIFDHDYLYPGRPQLYENNFVWDRNYLHNQDASVFSQLGRFEERGNTFDFQGHSEDTSRALVYNGAGAQSDEATGYIEGMKIKGLVGSAFRGYSAWLLDIKNSEFSCPFYDKNLVTDPRSFIIKDTSFKQFMFFDYRTYNTTTFPDPADYPTITLDGVTVLKDDVAINSTVLEFYNTGVNGCFNLIIKNCTFEAIVNVLNFCDFDNLGTVTINNCKFKAISAESYNFTSAKCDKVIVKNSEFTNVYWTKRAGDIFENNLIDGVLVSEYPVYADNAAAEVDLDVGEKYRTATGDMKVVY